MYTKHGMSKHPLYNTWTGIRLRCLNPDFWAYKHYGGRGITIHPPWQENAGLFLAWVDENLGPKPKGCTLDRIDNDRNYEPGNLKWSTHTEQVGNRRPQANKTGHAGVKKRLRRGREVYIARKVIDGKRREFEASTPEEALAKMEAAMRPKPRRTIRDKS